MEQAEEPADITEPQGSATQVTSTPQEKEPVSATVSNGSVDTGNEQPNTTNKDKSHTGPIRSKKSTREKREEIKKKQHNTRSKNNNSSE